MEFWRPATALMATLGADLSRADFTCYLHLILKL